MLWGNGPNVVFPPGSVGIFPTFTRWVERSNPALAWGLNGQIRSSLTYRREYHTVFYFLGSTNQQNQLIRWLGLKSLRVNSLETVKVVVFKVPVVSEDLQDTVLPSVRFVGMRSLPNYWSGKFHFNVLFVKRLTISVLTTTTGFNRRLFLDSRKL